MADHTSRDGLFDFKQTAPLGRAPFKHSAGLDLLPRDLSYASRFRLAAAAGFEGVEMEAVADRDEAAEVRDAAAAAGLPIHSVLTHKNWRHPLSSGDRSEVRKCVQALVGAMDNARLWGADTLLLIPAVVSASTSYLDAYTRSQSVIRHELLPEARERGIVLGIENVWNGFLLGPLEYVRYIDELDSPWIRAYLDVGNTMLSRPEDWIRIAGHRVVRLHVKDLRVDDTRGRFSFGKIGDGDVDWAAVRAALLEVGFSGWVTSTGVPRDRRIRWLERGRRLISWRGSNAEPVPGFPDRLLKPMQRRAEISFLFDVARRFERLRELRP